MFAYDNYPSSESLRVEGWGLECSKPFDGSNDERNLGNAATFVTKP